MQIDLPAVWQTADVYLVQPFIAVLAIVLIYDGARRLAQGDHRARPAALGILGLAVAIAMGSISVWTGSRMSDAGASLMAVTPKPLPGNWGASLTPEERDRESRSYAAAAYTSSGVLIDYFDKNGGWKKYSPTVADIAARDKMVAARARLGLAASEDYHAGMRWYALAFVAAAVGWLTGWNKLADDHEKSLPRM